MFYRLVIKIFIYILFSGVSKAQTDSVLVPFGQSFADGVYITHKDFRKNLPITKNDIHTDLNKEQIEFYSKLLASDKLLYKKNGSLTSINSNAVWGFVQNGTLFLNYGGNFYRVPVFGTICYFAGVVEVVGYYNGIYDPMFGMGGPRVTKTKEVHEFLMDYYDGNVVLFSVSTLEKMLYKDQEIYHQYKKLSKRNRRKQVSRYIRMYNEKHPMYYLISN